MAICWYGSRPAREGGLYVSFWVTVWSVDIWYSVCFSPLVVVAGATAFEVLQGTGVCDAPVTQRLGRQTARDRRRLPSSVRRTGSPQRVTCKKDGRHIVGSSRDEGGKLPPLAAKSRGLMGGG